LKRYTKGLDYIQRSLDLIIVFASWMMAYYLRFKLELGGESADSKLNFYIGFGVLLSLITLIVFKNLKLYDAMRLERQSKEIATQLKANVISFVVFLIIAFFVSEYRLSRIMLVFYFVISSFGLVWSKVFFRRIFSKRAMKFILVGNGDVALNFYKKISKVPSLNIIKWIDAPENIPENIPRELNVNPREIEQAEVDGFVIGYDHQDSSKTSELIKKLSDFIIPIIVLPDVSFARIGYSISEYKGQPLIYLNEPNIKQLDLVLKRIFDFVATSIGMLLISPLLVLIALLVKLTSRGPIFYGQVRMGVDGREFKMWKFRSMVVGEANKETWTVENDPRVTKVGKLLRKTNLDELPQLWNIIVGDMSLVGPRPERPQYVEQFREEIPGYMIRHKFKAGLTGWAQVNGWRGDTSIEKRIECDLWYIKNWSFALDIAIIFMTFFKGNKNAY